MRTDCPACTAQDAVSQTQDFATETVVLPNGEIENIMVKVPVMTCGECSFEWYDDRGEELIMKALEQFRQYLEDTNDPAFTTRSNNKIH